MKLWLLEQDVNGGYNTFDSCVVSAPTEEEARSMLPTDSKKWSVPSLADRYRADYWAPIENVVCTEIGEALPGSVKCVWCASFHAG